MKDVQGTGGGPPDRKMEHSELQNKTTFFLFCGPILPTWMMDRSSRSKSWPNGNSVHHTFRSKKYLPWSYWRASDSSWLPALSWVETPGLRMSLLGTVGGRTGNLLSIWSLTYGKIYQVRANLFANLNKGKIAWGGFVGIDDEKYFHNYDFLNW